ncbi:MAG: hypothetical protein HON90_08570, partial [Halobacteriovoraceae bacterium]|nr:hypothetical protein [Halobacteriovoraceae bacterium]
IVLIFSNILYLVFRKNKLIGLISLMKYPLFVYMVAFLSGATNYIWVFIATFYFVVREVLEEFFNIRHKTIEGILLLALILFKISFRYLP